MSSIFSMRAPAKGPSLGTTMPITKAPKSAWIPIASVRKLAADVTLSLSLNTSLSLSLSRTLSLTGTLSLALSLDFSLSLSLSLNTSLSLSGTLSHLNSLSLLFSPSISLSLALSLDFSLSLSLSPQTWLPRGSAQFRRLTWTRRGRQLEFIHIHVSSWGRSRTEKEGWAGWGELKRLG